MKLKYLSQIDFLRAIAVLSVVIFHFNPTKLPGGYLGVDVFFVISGFLITLILINDSSNSLKIYIARFYQKRIRRIFPALFTVVLTVLLTGYLFLPPEELMDLAKSGLYALTFLSNIYFYFNTGYFDAPAEMSPLLHTWSLGVEEQFYIFWPLLIFFLKNKSFFIKVAFITLCIISSMLIVVYFAQHDPSLTFYMLPFRVFQLGLGALLAIVYFRYDTLFRRNLIPMQYLGLSMICVSVLAFDSASSGLSAGLMASMGALLFLIGTLSNKSSLLFDNRVFALIGKLSFSLYLWHWPIIVFYKYYTGSEQIPLNDALLLFSLMLSLAYLSYRFIENPLRYTVKPKYFYASISTLCFLSISLASFFIQTSGVEQRLENAKLYSSKKIMWQWPCPEQLTFNGDSYCVIGQEWSKSKKKGILWGDSHAQHLMPLLHKQGTNNDISYIVIPSCRPVTDGKSVLIKHKNPKRATEGCIEAIMTALNLLDKYSDIKNVVLAGAWHFSVGQLYSENEDSIEVFRDKQRQLELFKQGLSYVLSELEIRETKVLLMGDIPYLGRSRLDCANQIGLLRLNAIDCSGIKMSEVKKLQGKTEKVLQEIASSSSWVKYHSIIASLCDSELCPVYLNGEFLYRDSDHIRRNFSDQMIDILIEKTGIGAISFDTLLQ